MQISHNYMYMYLSSFLSLPLSLSHPSRSSQNTRLDSLCHIATAHQLSILHTALCICWGCSRHLAHSLLPTLCPQVHSLHLCLHSFPKNNFLNTILLDSIYIYILIYDICFSLSDLLQSVQQALGSSTSLDLIQICSFIWLILFHCICVPHLPYPFICRWTSRLLPCPGYCK